MSETPAQTAIARGESPRRVVLGVDVLVGAFIDPDCRAVLDEWRDGRLRLVLHTPLLRRYLLALERLGAGREALRGWATWLTSPDKSIHVAATEKSVYVAAAAPAPDKSILVAAPKPAPDKSIPVAATDTASDAASDAAHEASLAELYRAAAALGGAECILTRSRAEPDSAQASPGAGGQVLHLTPREYLARGF
jgi:hypothetical protein